MLGSIKNKKFLSRIFSKIEIINSRKNIDKSGFFSKRFAAKEAFSKSFGTGIRGNLSFKDIIGDNKFEEIYLISRNMEKKEITWTWHKIF